MAQRQIQRDGEIFFDIDIAFGMKEKRNKRIRIPLSLF